VTFYKGQKWHRPKRSKHPRAKGNIRTSALQRQLLLAVRTCLIEKGYLTFPVAMWFRRSRLDFVAVPKQNPQRLLLVRPGRDRNIELLSYAGIDLFLRVHLESEIPYKEKLVWDMDLLPGKLASEDWKLFISRRCLYELSVLADVR